MGAGAAAAEFNEAILTIAESPGPALPLLVPQLRRLFSFDEAIAYRVVPAEKGARLDLLHCSGFLARDALEREADRFLAEAPARFALYDHLWPEVEQRNRVRVIDERNLPEPSPLMRLYRRVGLTDEVQLRVLICDGESLVAWVGGFRRDDFDDDEVQRFRRMIPALQSRLVLERRLADAEARAAALGPAMEALGAEAFLLDPKGKIVHANEIGRVALDRRWDVREEFARAVARGADAGWLVARVASRDRIDHLLVRKVNRGDPAPRLAAAAARWGLTRRQVDVLSHLVAGCANKTIADRLGCGVGTVELHVTAALQKAGADNRAALVAKFWTEL